MGTFTGRGVLSRVFGLGGIRQYFGPGSVVQEDFDPATNTYTHELSLDNVVLDHYVPEDEIHKRLERKLRPHNFYKTAVPAGILLGAIAGPIGAALGGLLGAGVGYSLNAVSHAGFEMQKSTDAAGETIYYIKSPTISGTLRKAASQLKHGVSPGNFWEFTKNEITSGCPHSQPSWIGALKAAGTSGAQIVRANFQDLKDFIQTQTDNANPARDLPEAYGRGVAILRDGANPCEYRLKYGANGAPKGQIVRDVNRIINTFTASEFGPRVRDYLSRKWDAFMYKLATA